MWVYKELGTDLGSWLVVAVWGFSMDQPQTQLQHFNEAGHRGIHYEYLLPM